MPKIAELREIDGAVWCRVGVPDEFPSGIALWTPDEVKEAKRVAVIAYIFEQKWKAAVKEGGAKDFLDNKKAEGASVVILAAGESGMSMHIETKEADKDTVMRKIMYSFFNTLCRKPHEYIPYAEAKKEN